MQPAGSAGHAGGAGGSRRTQQHPQGAWASMADGMVWLDGWCGGGVVSVAGVVAGAVVVM